MGPINLMINVFVGITVYFFTTTDIISIINTAYTTNTITNTPPASNLSDVISSLTTTIVSTTTTLFTSLATCHVIESPTSVGNSTYVEFGPGYPVGDGLFETGLIVVEFPESEFGSINNGFDFLVLAMLVLVLAALVGLVRVTFSTNTTKKLTTTADTSITTDTVKLSLSTINAITTNPVVVLPDPLSLSAITSLSVEPVVFYPEVSLSLFMTTSSEPIDARPPALSFSSIMGIGTEPIAAQQATLTVSPALTVANIASITPATAPLILSSLFTVCAYEPTVGLIYAERIKRDIAIKDARIKELGEKGIQLMAPAHPNKNLDLFAFGPTKTFFGSGPAPTPVIPAPRFIAPLPPRAKAKAGVDASVQADITTVANTATNEPDPALIAAKDQLQDAKAQNVHLAAEISELRKQLAEKGNGGM